MFLRNAYYIVSTNKIPKKNLLLNNTRLLTDLLVEI
jgi:hypothetical protein